MKSIVWKLIFLATATAVVLCAGPAGADFTVAGSADNEILPAVAYNPNNGLFAVASLVEASAGTFLEVRMFNGDGVQQGATEMPFGTYGDMLSRPDIIYNDYRDEFVVVAVTAGTTGWDHFHIQRLSTAGEPISSTSLFGALYDKLFHAGTNVGPIRVVYSERMHEYLVTAQIDTGTTTPEVAVWGQLVSDDLYFLGTPAKLTPTLGDLRSHAIAHADIVAPVASHYLLAYSEGSVGDSHLALIGDDLALTVSDIPFDWGTPDLGAGNVEVAFGKIHKTPLYFVVWSDGNNHKPGEPTVPWTGVWASFVDPYITSYTPGVPENEPFPISKIHSHMTSIDPYRPRVAYNEWAEIFFVAWPEAPSNVPENDPVCTHLRGAWIDYTEWDPLVHPHENVVLSEDTCNCQPPPSGVPFCASEEDPGYPAVAPLGMGGAVVVWQENWPPNPADQDIAGERFDLLPPPNDLLVNPTPVPAQGGTMNCTLVGAGPDANSSCGESWDQPAVWYEFTAPEQGILNVSTCGTSDIFGVKTGMDTVLSLHDPSGDQIHGLACNDNAWEWWGGAGCEPPDQPRTGDSYLNWALDTNETVLIRLARSSNSSGVHCLIHFDFEPGAGAGRLPQQPLWDGAPLMMEKAEDGAINLYWEGSCQNSDVDYGVYEGSLQRWDTHDAVLCSTDGMREALIYPSPGSSYYLVVPHNALYEGSFGTDGHGDERPRSLGACADQFIAECVP